VLLTSTSIALRPPVRLVAGGFSLFIPLTACMPVFLFPPPVFFNTSFLHWYTIQHHSAQKYGSNRVVGALCCPPMPSFTHAGHCTCWWACQTWSGGDRPQLGPATAWTSTVPFPSCLFHVRRSQCLQLCSSSPFCRPLQEQCLQGAVVASSRRDPEVRASSGMSSQRGCPVPAVPEDAAETWYAVAECLQTLAMPFMLNEASASLAFQVP
jgi:hypothetical protein